MYLRVDFVFCGGMRGCQKYACALYGVSTRFGTKNRNGNIMARKKKELPLLEQVTITGVAAEGKALARVNDLVVFAPYVVPGDVVDLQVRRKKHSYAEAEAVKFHEYSAERAQPFCQHYGVCGGCKWQCLAYEHQLKYKQQQVYDALVRIGKVELPEMMPILASEQTREYRNKLEFTFSNKR